MRWACVSAQARFLVGSMGWGSPSFLHTQLPKWGWPGDRQAVHPP